jgi:mRNA interferase RelE/StbE
VNEYEIQFSRSARKELESLTSEVVGRIFPKITALAGDPRPSECRKLVGAESFRIRVGDYRVIYSIDDDSRIIDIRAIRHRREAYK